MALPLNAPGQATARGMQLGQDIVAGLQDLRTRRAQADMATTKAQEYRSPKAKQLRDLAQQADIAEQQVRKLSSDALIELERENPGLHQKIAKSGAMQKIQTALLAAETAENEQRFNALTDYFAKQDFTQEGWDRFREEHLEDNPDIPEGVAEGLTAAYLMRTALRQTLPHQQAMELAGSRTKSASGKTTSVITKNSKGETVHYPSYVDPQTNRVVVNDLETGASRPIREGDTHIQLPTVGQTSEDPFSSSLETYAAKEIASNNEVIVALDNAKAMYDNPTGLKSGFEQLGAGIAGQLRAFGAPDGAANAVEAVMTNNADAHDMSVAASEYARITLAKSMSKSGRTFSALSYQKAGEVLGFGTIVDPKFQINRMQMLIDMKRADNMRWVRDIGSTGVTPVEGTSNPISGTRAPRRTTRKNRETGQIDVFINDRYVGSE